MKITAYSFLMAVLWSDSFILLSLLAMKWNRFIRHSVLPLVFFLFASVGRLVIAGEFPFARIIRVGETYEKILCFFAYPTSGEKIFGTQIYIGTVLMAVWFITAAVVLGVYIFRLLKSTRQIKKFKADPDPAAEKLLSELLMNRKQISHSVPVFRTSDTESPFCSGIFKQSIYLPETDFTDDELKGILVHEWSHACHHDVLVRALINVICILFWWNPLVYLLKRNMYQTMELRCDQEAQQMLSDDECVTYMETIVKIAELANGDKTAEAVKAGLIRTTDRHLVQRFEVLAIKDDDPAKARTASILFVTVMALLLALSYMFIIQPYAGYATPEDMNDDGFGLYSDTDNEIKPVSEETYFVDNGDGTYSFYSNGEFVSVLEGIDVINDLEIPIKGD